MNDMKMFFLGILIGVFVLVPLGAYGYVRLGMLSLATSAKPLPGEAFMAHTALRQSVAAARDDKNPLAVTDENLMGGVDVYRGKCAVCHGLPGQQKTDIAAGMFPRPPQLFQKDDMVTDDPEGTTHWKIKNGIRLSGMPGFSQMSDPQSWQVTMLLKHGDKLPAGVQAALGKAMGQ